MVVQHCLVIKANEEQKVQEAKLVNKVQPVQLVPKASKVNLENLACQESLVEKVIKVFLEFLDVLGDKDLKGVKAFLIQDWLNLEDLVPLVVKERMDPKA